MSANPATALLDAARTLAAHDPASPAELADLLRTLNDTGRDNLITILTGALDWWADLAVSEAWQGGDLIADMLRGAAENLMPVAQFLDKAREATGHYHREETAR